MRKFVIKLPGVLEIDIGVSLMELISASFTAAPQGGIPQPMLLSHRILCSYTCSRTYSCWFARFRILRGTRGTKPSSDDCIFMISYRALSARCWLQMWTHTHTHTHAHTHTHTHTPCQPGKGGFPGEAAMTLEASVRLRAWLVHVRLPPSLSRGWFWHAYSLAPTKKSYQIWDLRSPPTRILCSYRKFILMYTLTAPCFRGPPSLPPSHPPTYIPIHRHCFHIGRAKQCVVLCTQGWVRTKAALGSPSCKYWQLQIKVLSVVDIDTTF